MALKGSLIDMSLVDLLQAFGMSAKTGKIMLEQSGSLGGILWISKGSVANAATMNLKTLTPILAGESAVIEMLKWENATFRYIPAMPGEIYPRVITRSNEWLILEGLRQRDENAGKSLYTQITLDTRLRTVAQPFGAAKTLKWNYEEMLVLTLGANTTTIAEIVQATGYPESEIFGVVGRLMALRLIELESDDTTQTEETPPDMVVPFVASHYS